MLLLVHCTSDIARREIFSLIVAITFLSFMLNFVGLPMLITLQHQIFVVSILFFTEDLMWFALVRYQQNAVFFFVSNAFFIDLHIYTLTQIGKIEIWTKAINPKGSYAIALVNLGTGAPTLISVTLTAVSLWEWVWWLEWWW